ncbi:hypothetical protein WDU94_014577 [Cyamophila willieti]
MILMAFLGHKLAAQCVNSTIVLIKTKKRLFTLLIIIFLYSLAILTIKLTRNWNKVFAEFSDSIERGTAAYLLDKDWKLTLDHMQSQLKCCGANNYTDWFRTSWIPIDSLNLESTEFEKFVQPNGHVIAPFLPFSCCRSDYPGVCSLSLPTTKPPNLSFYSTGCVQVISTQLLQVSDWLISLSVLYGVLSVCGCVLIHYLYTSTRNALILNKDMSVGWLYGPEDIGYEGNDSLNTYEEEINIETNRRYPSISERSPAQNSNRPTKFLDKSSEDIEQWCRNGSGKYMCDPQTMRSSKVKNNVKFSKTSKIKQTLLPRHFKMKTDQQEKEPLLK